MRVSSLACLLLISVVTCDAVKSYRGYHVLSAEASTQEQLTVLRDLEQQYDVVYLRDPSLVVSTDMAVSPEHKDQVLDTLREAGITVTVQSADLQADIDEEKEQSFVRGHQHQGKGHDFYRTLDEVHDAMVGFTTSYPNVEMKPMNHNTSEGRTVYYLQIGAPDKDVIFVETLAHAREWATTASVLYIVDETLKLHGRGDEAARIALEEFTWIIIPVVNPDGYHYTWTDDRLWRKNRKKLTGNTCTPNSVGIDLNRNYDIRFGEVGVSSECGHSIYPGEEPFSEPETQNVRDLFYQFQDRIVAFLSVHAYSQLLLIPWAHLQSMNPEATELPPNFDKLENTGRKMVAAIKSVHGKIYQMGTPYQTLNYAASGGSYDWALSVKPGIYSYCYEVRPAEPRGGSGFILPPEQIIPLGQEIMQSVFVLLEDIWEERRMS